MVCGQDYENDILRMYGRTDGLPDSFRCLNEPVILDGKDYFVKMIIRFSHEKANSSPILDKWLYVLFVVSERVCHIIFFFLL